MESRKVNLHNYPNSSPLFEFVKKVLKRRRRHTALQISGGANTCSPPSLSQSRALQGHEWAQGKKELLIEANIQLFAYIISLLAVRVFSPLISYNVFGSSEDVFTPKTVPIREYFERSIGYVSYLSSHLEGCFTRLLRHL